MTDPLATVRRAYRYIAAYERRVLDAVDVVDEAVLEFGFERRTQHRWTPLYNKLPSKKYGPERWVWDYLPNYAMRYEWISGEPNTAGNTWVFMDHVADTAFERRSTEEPSEPNPLDDLGSAEDARSVLRWHVVEFRDAIPTKAYSLSWNNLLKAQVGSGVLDWLPADSTSQSIVRRGGLIQHTVHCIDVSVLTDADSLRALFIQPLRELLTGLTTNG